MKKIILLTLILATQTLFAGECSQKEAELVVNKFLKNEIKCSKKEYSQDNHIRTRAFKIPCQPHLVT